MTEFAVAQSIDIPLTKEDTATVTAVASTRNGRGTGSLTTSFRRILPDLSWFRVCQSTLGYEIETLHGIYLGFRLILVLDNRI